MKQFLFFILIIFQLSIQAQTIISGKVIDEQGKTLEGVNVYLKGTYDGISTDENGKFSFKTSAKGKQTLIVSFISFETYTKTALVSTFTNVIIKLREDVNTLDAVEINAGSFKAGDNAKVTALKPLDVVTTASALGDFIGALQTLPGTSNVDEDGRLFVRGGEADETQIFVDGLRVFTPYSPSSRNNPTRGRFSPFLFKGINFSTGGYSAEYGQALSSVLLLDTNDEAVEEKTELGFMTLGLSVGNTQIWNKNSLSVNVSYFNLAPYQSAFPDKNKWNKPFRSMSGETVYRHRYKNDGLLKVYGAFSYTDFDVVTDDINLVNGFRFGLKNRNLYTNVSYKNELENDWTIFSGFSFTNDSSDLIILNDKVNNEENSVHLKIKLKKRYSNRFKLNFGAEYFSTKFDEKFMASNNGNFSYGYINNIAAGYVETDIFFSKKLATKIGLRGEYSELFNDFTVSPRISIAYKAAENAQFSLAYGQFYQNPEKDYLKFNTDFKAASTSHLIANYQYVKNKQILRVEAYYKNYKNLVKYDTEFPLPNTVFTNNGNAYAKGIDVFWRDDTNIKNLSYWMSYSFLDTERNYKNYTTAAKPSFVSKHNISLVGKYWMEGWKSQIGLSYNFASGRTYTNPNINGFLNAETNNYNSVSFNWAYLLSQQKILYFSVNNILGRENISGYQYKNQPNANGFFERKALVRADDRFFFIGFFWTISDNKKDNQLNNL